MTTIAPARQHQSVTDGSENGQPLWYAVQTKPLQEDRARANLGAVGFETFLPNLRRLVDRGGRRAVRVEPLFPRYLFAKFDDTVGLHRVRNTRGVVRVLGSGSSAVPVDESIIDGIRARVGPDGYVQLTPPRKGDHVRITGGPWRGFVGVFEASRGSAERVALLLSAVHGKYRLVIEQDLIERIGERAG
ncbi:MAG: transcription termination/antitermination protein NusG [Vicinamibacterales bacterium]